MGRKQQRNKKVAISRDIRNFTQDIYKYVWSNQDFFSESVDQKYFDDLSSMYTSVGERKITHFTENIGKAVRVCQFLLRDYFLNFFKFLTPEKSYFKKEVKILWSHWFDNRDNIFVKVIETIAIITEAFLFCDYHMNFKFEFNETTEWFIELFEENLASEFFKCGGWKKLHSSSDGWYISMFNFLEEKAYMSYSPTHSDTVKNIYNCDLIDVIRYCPVVKYPVPENVICDNCRHRDDANFYQSIVYVRLANEKPEIIRSKGTDNSRITLPTKIRGKIENESLTTDEKVSSEYLLENALTIKQDSPLLKLEEQNFNTHISKYISERCSSLLSKLNSIDADHTIQQDFESSAEENFRKKLKEANVGLLTATKNSSTEENLPKNKIFVKELNAKREQNEGILNEVAATLKENIVPDDIFSEKQLKVHYEKHTDEKQCSFVNFESKILSSADSEINSVIEFPPKTEFVHNTSLREQSPKSNSPEAPLSKWSSPESSCYLQQTLTNEERSPTKLVLKTAPPDKESSNKQDSRESLEICFQKSDSLFKCLLRLHQAVLKNYLQIKELSSQNRFYLISEKYSHCLGLLFKDNLENSLQDIPKSLQISEVPTETLQKNDNSKKESHESDVFSLKFKSCAYRCYFLGEQKLLQSATQMVKIGNYSIM